MNNVRPYVVLMIVLLSCAFFMQALLGSRTMSLTWDEPSYIASGHAYLTTYDYRFNPSHPPLMRSLEALPLLFMDITSTPPNQAEVASRNPQAEYGYRFVYQSGNDPRKIAAWCRLPAMIAGTGLILAIFFWGRELYGDGPALFAAALAAFCPNLLAQSKVAVEDIGCATFVFISVWLFWKSLNRQESRCLWLCGIVTGMALLSKYTSLLLAPIYVLLAIRHYFAESRRNSIGGYLAKACIIVLTAMAVVSAAYNFNPITYFSGLNRIYTDLNNLPTWYFFGEPSSETRWYYYLVSFFLKTPVPTLLAIFIAAFFSVRNHQYRKHTFVLLAPVLVIFLVTCFDKGNFGIRRVLPALPFLYLFAARIAAGKGAAAKVIPVLTVSWLAVEMLLIFPHHTAYFNIAAGGPKRAPYLLVADDSDVGQDLPALADWQRNHPEAGVIRLIYNGSADPGAYGVKATQVSYSEIEEPLPGIYAISITALVNTPWLQYAKPVARAGYSIYIYQF